MPFLDLPEVRLVLKLDRSIHEAIIASAFMAGIYQGMSLSG